jgi:DNA-binding Lrp family transcriptional regulator
VVQAYVLIETEPGKAYEVVSTLKSIPGASKVDAVTGPYDVIMLAEAEAAEELGKLVLTKIHTIPSVTRTLTCSVVSS